MSGSVLIVDTVATNRIVLKVKLLAAQYQVSTCDTLIQADQAIRAASPDLILLDMAGDMEAALAFCRSLRADAATATIPIVATGPFPTDQSRIDTLAAGADDILTRPFSDDVLQARLRSLLRANDARSELRLRDDTRRALGFAETTPTFTPRGTVWVIRQDDQDGDGARLDIAAALPATLACACQTFTAQKVLEARAALDAPDIFIIDVTNSDRLDVFRLVSELRSRSETRLCGLMILLPDGADDIAAMALDLGANDVTTQPVTAAEIALRTQKLLDQKREQDRLRATVRNGLEAAVTDPLTGLFNRRYALSHLARMAERAREKGGRDFAVMVLDIDHFKTINDTYGHATGDQILIDVASRLRDNLRAVDMIARIGGEEFLIAMPETTTDLARAAAERLRNIIGSQPFVTDHPSGAIKVTLSIGVAVGGRALPLPDGPKRMVDKADAALYAAKTAGRNMVSLSAA